MYYREAGLDAAAMSVDCLVGRQMTDLDSSAAPGAWVFRFGADCWLTVEGIWRVIGNGRIRVAGSDHQHMFGLKEPVDSRHQAMQEIGTAVVAEVSFDDVIGDLRLEFASHIRLEVLTESAGYESWTLWRPDGTQLVAVGGGEVVPYAKKTGG